MSPETGIESLPSIDTWHLDILANYGGTDRKTGLIDPCGLRYMVKYAEKKAPRNSLATSHVNNAVSEYMASHILDILGYETHKTLLGTLNGEIVVACRNFIPAGAVLIEFEKFMRRQYYSRDIEIAPDIAQVYQILETDAALSPQAGYFKSRYWELFIGDALIGNSGRHIGDFGYIIDPDNQIRMSPVYDNGSSLYPGLSEKEMEETLDSPKETMRRILLFPRAGLKIRGNKAGYYDIMASGICDDLTQTIISTIPRIRNNLSRVYEFIDNCAFLSSIRKKFYKTMLAARMDFILEAACAKCINHSFDLNARTRLMNGTGYRDKDLEIEWSGSSAKFTGKILNICQSAGYARGYHRELHGHARHICHTYAND